MLYYPYQPNVNWSITDFLFLAKREREKERRGRENVATKNFVIYKHRVTIFFRSGELNYLRRGIKFRFTGVKISNSILHTEHYVNVREVV